MEDRWRSRNRPAYCLQPCPRPSSCNDRTRAGTHTYCRTAPYNSPFRGPTPPATRSRYMVYSYILVLLDSQNTCRPHAMFSRTWGACCLRPVVARCSAQALAPAASVSFHTSGATETAARSRLCNLQDGFDEIRTLLCCISGIVSRLAPPPVQIQYC